MKFLVAGDPHLDPSGPSTRIDSYSDACFRKIQFCISLAESLKVDYLALTGDTNGEGIESRTFRIAMKSLLKSSRVPIISLIGNHPGDTIRSRFSTWETREFGDYVVSGCFKPIIGFQPLLDDQGVRVGSFLGLNAYEYRRNSLPTEPSEENAKVRVIFAHTFIDIPDLELSFSTKDLKTKYPNLEAIFAGHDHQQYAPIQLQGVWIFRPGSLLRTSNDESSQRIPHVVFYDTETKHYEFYPVTVALEPRKIFSVELKNNRLGAAEQIRSFHDSLSKMVVKSSSVADLVWGLADKADLSTRDIIREDLQSNGFKR